MIDIITSIIGGYDNLHEPESPDAALRYLCYTDEPRYDSHWQLQPITRSLGCVSADSRLPKILSHLHTGPDCEMSAWMDGCFAPRWYVGAFVRSALAHADVAVFVHPRRDAFREAEYCRKEGVGDDQAIHAQLERYRSEGFPGTPFVCGGVILRRENEAVRAFNELWWREYRATQKRDQFSLAYALWKSQVRVNVIERDILTENEGFSFHFHAWCETQDAALAAERARQRTRWEAIQAIT